MVSHLISPMSRNLSGELFLVDLDEAHEGADVGKYPDLPGSSFRLLLDRPLDAASGPYLPAMDFGEPECHHTTKLASCDN